MSKAAARACMSSFLVDGGVGGLGPGILVLMPSPTKVSILCGDVFLFQEVHPSRRLRQEVVTTRVHIHLERSFYWSRGIRAERRTRAERGEGLLISAPCCCCCLPCCNCFLFLRWWYTSCFLFETRNPIFCSKQGSPAQQVVHSQGLACPGRGQLRRAPHPAQGHLVHLPQGEHRG